MSIHQRINRFFDHAWMRWLLIIGFCLLLLMIAFPTPQSEYKFSRTEKVEIISLRPMGSYGSPRLLVSFKLNDGRFDTLTLLSNESMEGLEKGSHIDVDILEHPKKQNRYRLAQPPAAP